MAGLESECNDLRTPAETAVQSTGELVYHRVGLLRELLVGGASGLPVVVLGVGHLIRVEASHPMAPEAPEANDGDGDA
jgi:hypothetical protein